VVSGTSLHRLVTDHAAIERAISAASAFVLAVGFSRALLVSGAPSRRRARNPLVERESDVT